MRADNQKYQPGARHGEQRPVRRPFDSHDIERLPMATKQDPPYRPWWVVDVPPSEDTAPEASRADR